MKLKSGEKRKEKIYSPIRSKGRYLYHFSVPTVVTMNSEIFSCYTCKVYLLLFLYCVCEFNSFYLTRA